MATGSMARGSSTISMLEHSLLLRQSSDGQLRQVLFSYLEGGRALKDLRMCSRVLRDIVSWHMFQQLSMPSHLVTDGQTKDLESLGQYCRHLTIRISTSPQIPRCEASAIPQISSSASKQASIRATSGDRPPKDTHVSRQEEQIQHRRRWYDFLLHFQPLESLTLQVENGPAWPGSADIGNLLIAIRVALQHANLENLCELALHPISAIDVIHLRWLGLGAYSSTPAVRRFWEKLHTLRIFMQSPFGADHLTPPQSAMFKKILYDYLRSLAPTLRMLQFVWIGAPGPSPVALHMEPELRGGEVERDALGISTLQPRQAIVWPQLEQLWLGNVAHAEHNGALERTVASRLRHFYVLAPWGTTSPSQADTIESLVWVDMMARDGMERLVRQACHRQI